MCNSIRLGSYSGLKMIKNILKEVKFNEELIDPTKWADEPLSIDQRSKQIQEEKDITDFNESKNAYISKLKSDGIPDKKLPKLEDASMNELLEKEGRSTSDSKFLLLPVSDAAPGMHFPPTIKIKYKPMPTLHSRALGQPN